MLVIEEVEEEEWRSREAERVRYLKYKCSKLSYIQEKIVLIGIVQIINHIIMPVAKKKKDMTFHKSMTSLQLTCSTLLVKLAKFPPSSLDILCICRSSIRYPTQNQTPRYFSPFIFRSSFVITDGWGKKKEKNPWTQNSSVSKRAVTPNLLPLIHFIFSACLHVKADVPVIDEGAIVVVVRGTFSTEIKNTTHTFPAVYGNKT